MARFDYLSGPGGRTVQAPTSHYKDVTEFRGMNLDMLAKQYALYRQLNALDAKTPVSSSPAGTEVNEPSPGLMNRLLGRLPGF